jgi:hypothetical protein
LRRGKRPFPKLSLSRKSRKKIRDLYIWDYYIWDYYIREKFMAPIFSLDLIIEQHALDTNTGKQLSQAATDV